MEKRYTSEAIRKVIETTDGRFLFGQNDVLEMLMIAWLARGHMLIEGPPGVAKTLTAKLMGALLGKSFRRIQFTSDLIPGDILGAHVYSPDTREFRFLEGPVFSDVIVADEINRAPPRTQSALLEAMEERQVTVDGTRFRLSPDFLVVATQNPGDFEGTFPLPEVQLDRFLLILRVDHADRDTEVKILSGAVEGVLPPDLSEVEPLRLDREQCDREIDEVRVDSSVLGYVADLLAATRRHPMLSSGCSVRAGLALVRCARIRALLAGRDYVTPDDIKTLVPPAMSHRVRLSPEAEAAGHGPVEVLRSVVEGVAFPE